jgi:hypothetical protein
VKTKEKTEKIVTGKIDFSVVEKIYFGLDHNCRCGCGGDYYYPGSWGWDKIVNEIKNLGTVDAEKETEWNIYINIPIGNNLAYTLYFLK